MRDLRVYICAGVRATPGGLRRTLDLAARAASDGPVTVLVAEHLIGVGVHLDSLAALDHRVDVVPVGGRRPGHWYFCDEQADADLVHDILLERGWHVRSGSLVFVDCTHTALTVLRARRLLGMYSRSAVSTVEGEATREALAADAGTVHDVFTRWAIRQVSTGLRRTGSVSSYRRSDPDSPGRISVVIPLFNQGPYVRNAVASVRREDVGDIEIVVVDDGSTDPETVRVFAGLSRVVKVAQPNRGLAAARNSGICRSTGEYVVPLDADDAVVPGFLAAARDALRRAPELGYVVPYIRYTGLLDLTYVPAGFIPELSLFLHTHGKAFCMFRRSALDAVGGYDERFTAFEDWELQIALYRAGIESEVLPVIGQNYRRHVESMSFSKSNAIRHELVQQLIRKHSDMLHPDELRTGMLVLAHLWKTGYEPSTSVLLQRRMAAG
jgi:GT2 family glycosyltransferase